MEGAYRIERLGHPGGLDGPFSSAMLFLRTLSFIIILSLWEAGPCRTAVYSHFINIAINTDTFFYNNAI